MVQLNTKYEYRDVRRHSVEHEMQFLLYGQRAVDRSFVRAAHSISHRQTWSCVAVNCFHPSLSGIRIDPAVVVAALWCAPLSDLILYTTRNTQQTFFVFLKLRVPAGS